MKNKFKIIIPVLLIVLVFVVPLIINILFKNDFGIWWIESEWTAGEALTFYGTVLSFIGTITLGVVSIWQTKKANEQTKEANEMNKRLIQKELLDDYCFAILENKFELDVKFSKDNYITHSAHHKKDNGATIVYDQFDETAKGLYEHYLRLYFKNQSKSLIKSVVMYDLICVQDSNPKGLIMGDIKENLPIPNGLDIDKCVSPNVQINWLSDDEFFIHMKIYSPEDGIFHHFIKNPVPFCMMFELDFTSISNTVTKIGFKILFNKDNVVLII